jgi:hypothetical protein
MFRVSKLWSWDCHSLPPNDKFVTVKYEREHEMKCCNMFRDSFLAVADISIIIMKAAVPNHMTTDWPKKQISVPMYTCKTYNCLAKYRLISAVSDIRAGKASRRIRYYNSFCSRGYSPGGSVGGWWGLRASGSKWLGLAQSIEFLNFHNMNCQKRTRVTKYD